MIGQAAGLLMLMCVNAGQLAFRNTTAVRANPDGLGDEARITLRTRLYESDSPALDARGIPVAAWFGYKQVDISRRLRLGAPNDRSGMVGI